MIVTVPSFDIAFAYPFAARFSIACVCVKPTLSWFALFLVAFAPQEISANAPTDFSADAMPRSTASATGVSRKHRAVQSAQAVEIYEYEN